MSATCVPWYMLRGNTCLSEHSDPVFPHFCPLNQNLDRVRVRGGGGATSNSQQATPAVLCVYSATSDTDK